MAPDKDIRINLIGKDDKLWGRRKNLMICLLAALLMLSGMLGTYSHSNKRLIDLQAENSRLQEEYIQTDTLLRKAENTEGNSDLLEEKKSMVLQVQNSQTSTLKILHEIEKTIPVGIRLIEIEIGLEEVSLKGFAFAQTPEVLLSALSNSNSFAEVRMIASQSNENTGEIFFELEVARGEGE